MPRFAKSPSAWLMLALLLASPMARAQSTSGDKHLAALQACPAVKNEIVDLHVLEQGLKDSSAVGLFEKLRLKSAIDDLIERMKAFHKGERRFTLAELQEQYDLLMMRIAQLLQDKDAVAARPAVQCLGFDLGHAAGSPALHGDGVMTPLARRLCVLGLACLGLAGCQTAPPSHRELIRDHLAKLIGAEPAPCGDVKSYVRKQRLQYRVECQTGDVYGVGVAPDGRVSVTPQAPAAAASSPP